MPKFAVEVQYLLPVWNCVIVEAENADAAQKAVMFDESSHTWDQQVEDYESSRASTIEGWREIPDQYDAEDLNAATPQGLWDFIHSHVRLCQMQASELVACEQARVLGSSGQGRRRGR